MHRLAGKVVLVTGGSSGIGRGSALRLAGLGCRVAVAARSPAALDDVVREIASRGGEAVALPTDVSDSEQCRQAVENTVARFGQLDILLCSAGLSMRAYFEGTDLAAMERVLRINLFGVLYCTHFRPAAREKAARLTGALSSLTAGAARHRTQSMRRLRCGDCMTLRLELKRDGVHVGVVSPGFVDTPRATVCSAPTASPWARAAGTALSRLARREMRGQGREADQARAGALPRLRRAVARARSVRREYRR